VLCVYVILPHLRPCFFFVELAAEAVEELGNPVVSVLVAEDGTRYRETSNAR